MRRCPQAWEHALVLLALLVAFSSSATALTEGGFVVSGARYYVKLAGGRAGCADEADFMGYLNKTCTAGTTTAAYGPTVGPLLRGEGSKSWEQWLFSLVGRSPEGDDLVTIKASYPSGRGQPLCQGFMAAEKQSACAAGPWAQRVHIHTAQKYAWRVARVKGDDSFNLIAESRAAGCLRFLGGSPTCNDPYLHLYPADSGTGQQRWLISRVGGASAPPPPSSPPAPLPVAAPPPLNSPPPKPSPPAEAPSPAAPAPVPAAAPAPVPDGPPSLAVSVPGSTTVDFRITPASFGTPAFSYTLNFTQASAPFASVILALAPGVLEGRATGLAPFTFYSATATGMFAGGSATPSSPPVQFATVAKPRPPSTTPLVPSATCTDIGQPLTLAAPLDNYDYFGSAAAISGDGLNAVVGAYGYNGYSGAAFMFTRASTAAGWGQGSVVASGASCCRDDFGHAVAMSASGAAAIVGAPKVNNKGAAYALSPGGLRTQLTGAALAANDFFGGSVALSGDGLTALVGAPQQNSEAGAVYVFSQSNTGAWSAATTLATGTVSQDLLGTSAALSADGTKAVLGAYGVSSGAGAAYVYTKTSGVWGTGAALTLASGPAAGAAFGSSVSMSANGNAVIVGAPDVYSRTGGGNAYLFTFSGAWSAGTALTLGAPLADGDEFGYSVALSAAGTTAVVGARGANQAYKFTASGGGSWGQGTALATGLAPVAAGSAFGSSVAISADGISKVVGAPVAGAKSNGAAFTFC